LAKETGWDHDTILDMPLARVWMFRHSLLRSYEIPCFFASNKTEDAFAEFRQLTGSLLTGGGTSAQEPRL